MHDLRHIRYCSADMQLMRESKIGIQREFNDSQLWRTFHFPNALI